MSTINFSPRFNEQKAASIIQKNYKNFKLKRELNYRIGHRLLSSTNDERIETLAFNYLSLAGCQKHPHALFDLSTICANRRFRSGLCNNKEHFQLEFEERFFLKEAARQGLEKAHNKLITFNQKSNDRFFSIRIAEAIFYFLGQPSSVYKEDVEAYMILAEGLQSPFPSEDLKLKILKIVEKKANAIAEILKNKRPSSQCLYNIFKMFLKLSNLDPSLKDRTIYTYLDLDGVFYRFKGISGENDLFKLQSSPHLNDQERKNVSFFLAYEQLMRKREKPFTNNELAQIFQQAASDLNFSELYRHVANFALAMMCYRDLSNLLTDKQTALILKNTHSLSELMKRNEASGHFDDFQDLTNPADLALATMRSEWRTDVINDQEMHNILLSLERKNYEAKEIAKLLKGLYLEKRLSPYQRLTLANNFQQPLHFTITAGQMSEEIILQKSEQKVYMRPKESNISYVSLKVQDTFRKILVEKPAIEMNTYVSCYGADNLKFAVYYEPDAQADSQDPPKEKVKELANRISSNYAEIQKRCPSISIETYIMSLVCNIPSEFSDIMRPSHLQKAINSFLPVSNKRQKTS